MAQIVYPTCGARFSLDGADYANIVNQVRNIEFERDVKNVEARLISQKEIEKKDNQTRK